MNRQPGICPPPASCRQSPPRHRRSARAARLVALLAVGSFVLGGCATETKPTQARKSGEQVYRQVCAACHATGVDKAPQLGDRKAWAPLIEEGQDTLTAHAWVGVRGMPPRGGDPSLSLEEFSRSVAYMARAAGGDWRDPDEEMLEEIREEEEDRIEDLREREKDD